MIFTNDMNLFMCIYSPQVVYFLSTENLNLIVKWGKIVGLLLNLFKFLSFTSSQSIAPLHHFYTIKYLHILSVIPSVHDFRFLFLPFCILRFKLIILFIRKSRSLDLHWVSKEFKSIFYSLVYSLHEYYLNKFHFTWASSMQIFTNAIW